MRILFSFLLIASFLSCSTHQEKPQLDFFDVSPRGYSHSVQLTQGNAKVIYVSGQVPVDKNGNLVGEGDLEKQTAQVFENIKTQVENAGGSMNDLINIECYFTDISKIAEFRKARDKYINLQKPPASVAVEVNRLINEKFLIEISAVALVNNN